jgi:molybdopterin synthase sulfur carrier subunit
MPDVVLASSLTRWLTPEPGFGTGPRRCSAEGSTLRQVLDSLFEQFPALRDYVTDERGALRHHVAAFVDGSAIHDKEALLDEVPANAEVYVFQALSGG